MAILVLRSCASAAILDLLSIVQPKQDLAHPPIELRPLGNKKFSWLEIIGSGIKHRLSFELTPHNSSFLAYKGRQFVTKFPYTWPLGLG